MVEPLYIQPEVQNSQRTFFDWISVTNNSCGTAKVYPIREKSFLDWERHSSNNALEAIRESTQRWIRMSQDLKTKGLHSLENLDMAIRRMPRYIMLGRSLKSYWFPL